MKLTAPAEGEESGAVYNKAVELLAKLDETNEKRKNAPKKPSKTSVENAPVADAIVEFLDGVQGTAVAKDIAAAVGVSVQKASAILRGLADEGRVKKTVPENRNKPIEFSKVAE